MVVNSVGTYCVVIKKQLAVKQCPIRTCAWKKNDGQCGYVNQEMTVQELAMHLGKPSPADEQKVRADLYKAVKNALIT